MNGPIELHVVTCGIYEDKQTVAVFTVKAEALSFAQYMNSTHPCRASGDEYVVDETVPFYRPETWIPPVTPDVLADAEDYCDYHDFYGCQFH